MESVIGLRFSALPSPYVRIMPSGFHAARAAKPHLGLRCSFLSVTKLVETRSLSLRRYRSSLSLSRSSGGRRPLDGIIGPVCCSADGSPSKQSGSDEESQQQKQSQPQLKASEPIAKENIILFNQIIDCVKVLKDSENYNFALKLLKESEQLFKEEESLATIRFKIMEILYGQGKYQEAFDYWIRLCEMKSPQMRNPLFKCMQCDLFSTMTKLLECLKEKTSSKDISSDLLRSMNELKKMDIPESMGIRGEDLPSIPTDDLEGNLSFGDS